MAGCLAIGAVVLATIAARDAKVSGETVGASADGFSKTIGPFVEQYCSDCHSGDSPEAKLDLTKYADAAAVLRDRRIWRKVFFKLEAGEMPPADHPQPKPAETAAVTHWIDEQLSRPVPIGQQDPGRPVIRRLNRAEYNNTIRDLMAVDFHPADDFPTDDVGEGFDNIGAVLSLSPLLMEKYLSAAEQCVGRALTILPESPPPTVASRGSHLDGDARLEKIHRGIVWISGGELYFDWQAPKTGQYIVRVRAFGEPVGDETVRMAIKLDGRELQRFVVKEGTKSEAATYEHPIRIESGSHRVAVAMVGPPHTEKSKSANSSSDRSTLAIVNLEIEGPIAEHPTPPESYRRIVICQPATESGGGKTHAATDPKAAAVERADCARRVIRKFADRAFRRPATDEEVSRLMTLWRKADARDPGPFDRSLMPALEAVLVSPQFLYRVETDPVANPMKPHRISDYELASRMSYFLWSSMPDDELFALARRGALHDPATLELQVRRMIADPKSHALVDNFASQWLQYRRLASIAPDKTIFPHFDESLRSDMRRETELFFTHVMREDLSVLEFLDSAYTFLNHRLARLYGIYNVEGSDFRQVSTVGTNRGGLLTQASILLVTSNPARTSPVKRGKWILENLLGAAPPPPPANVPPLKEEQKSAADGTLRQRLEQHRSNALCASCHKTMDPLGFGLENFDAIGRWRTMDGRLPIDARGTLPSGQSFDGVDGLKKILLARRDQFCHFLAEKMLTYALGRAVEDSDAAAVDQIAHDAAANNYRFSSFVVGIVRSAPFLMRRGSEQSEKVQSGKDQK